LLHPEILSALAQAGHGSRVMIADGNYPFSTESAPTAKKVFLNLRPGLVAVTDVLEVLIETIPLEAALVMRREDGAAVPIHDEFRRLLPAHVPLNQTARQEFYAEVKAPRTALVIATGEQRRFANLLLTIGVVA
jgi:L-fucose mutarotase